ncbi:MAG: hypothetical protein VW010_04385, partial [Flavobacteriaceae bacterium]
GKSFRSVVESKCTLIKIVFPNLWTSIFSFSSIFVVGSDSCFATDLDFLTLVIKVSNSSSKDNGGVPLL